MTKRPPLSSVLGKQTELPDPVSATPHQRERVPMVQLNVAIPATLRKQARLKAMDEEREMASIVRELLERWVNERPQEDHLDP